MVICFRGTSFVDMMGVVDWYMKIENKNGEVNVEDIKAKIEEVREYVNSVFYDEDSDPDEYHKVEMWGAPDYAEEAMNRLGYSCELIANDLEASYIKSDTIPDVDIKVDVTIDI